MAEATERDWDIELDKGDEVGDTIIWQLELGLKGDDGLPLETLRADSWSSLRISQNYQSPVLVELTTGNGITINPDTGLLAVTMMRSHTSAIPTGIKKQRYVYDWDLVDDNDRHIRLLKGRIYFYADV